MDPRARSLLIAAEACAALFALILVLAYGFPAARELDAKALVGFLGLQRPVVGGFTAHVVKLGDPPTVGVLGLLIALVALLRGRRRLALAVIVLLALTSVSSQVLKAVLAFPRYQGQTGFAHVTPAAFPSGHSTAAMTLAIATVMVVPRGLRPLAAAVGGGIALAVGISVVLQGWHFPSDVAGGFLLATGWGLVVLAGLREAQVRRPEAGRGERGPGGLERATDVAAGAGLAAVAVIGVLLVLGAIVLTEATIGVGHLVRGHTAAVLVGGCLLLLALVLIGGFVAGLSQREPE